MATGFHAKGSGGQTSSASSFSITCTISAGDAVVVFGSWDQASATTPTVATTGGTGSDAFTLVYGPFTSGVYKYGAWLLQSAGTGRTGATVSWSANNPTFADAGCISYTGQAASILDQVKFATGSGTSPTSGNTPTLTSSDELAVGFAASISQVTAAGSPWTDDGVISSTQSWIEHQIVTATTPVSTVFTSINDTWISFALTFKASPTTAPFVNQTATLARQWDIPGGPSWQQAYNNNLFKNPIPFTQYDWSKPFRMPRSEYDKSVGLNPNLYKNPIPFLNQFGPGFWEPRLPVPSQPYNQSLYTVTVIAAPFINPGPTSFSVTNIPTWQQPYNQNLYTNPYPIQNLYTWSFGIADIPAPPQPYNSNLYTNPIPFVNAGPTSFAVSDFPTPQQPYNPNLYQIVVSATPFNQTFWPPVVRVPSAPIDFYNLVLLQVDVLPFSQTDQSTSFRFRSSEAPDQPYNPNLYTVIISAVPFNQTDWTPSSRIHTASVPGSGLNPNLFTNPYPVQNLFGPVSEAATIPAPQQPYNPNLFTPANPYPFQNISLALVPSRSFPLLDVPYNQALYATPATPLPFNTYDYPRVVRVQVAPYDLSLGLNTNLFTNPIPIFNYAYPTPHTQPPSLLDGSIGFQIFNIPVIAATLIQRTLTGVGL